MKKTTMYTGTEARAGRYMARGRAARAAQVAAMRGREYSQIYVNKGEFKAVDASSNAAADTTGTLVLLNGMARGDDINTRVGREVTMKSIELHWRAYVTAGTGTDQVHRLLIVYDRQANAAALTGAQVLTTFDTISLKNLENRKRFKIMYDQTIYLNATGEPGAGNVGKWYRRLRHPVTFNSGNAGTVADITTGSLYALVVGSEAAGATAGNILLKTRIRYLDN